MFGNQRTFTPVSEAMTRRNARSLMIVSGALGLVVAVAACTSGAGGPLLPRDRQAGCVSSHALIRMQTRVGATVRVGVGRVVPIWLIEPEAYASGADHTQPPSAFPWLAPASTDANGLTPLAVCKHQPLVMSLPARVYAFRAIRPGRYQITAPLNPAYHLPHLVPRLPPLRPVHLTVVVTPGGVTSPASGQTTYTVVAPVLYLRKVGTPLACLTVLESLPPAGCGGVPVTGYDFRHLVGRVRFHGMGWQSRHALRLVGTWNGHVLTLTRPPSRVRRSTPAPSPPTTCRPTPTGTALGRRITRAHMRLNMLELGPCGKTAWVLVAVADRATISFIHHRFGRSVIVTGWLRPRP